MVTATDGVPVKQRTLSMKEHFRISYYIISGLCVKYASCNVKCSFTPTNKSIPPEECSPVGKGEY